MGLRAFWECEAVGKPLKTLDALSELGYIRYTLDVKTKKLTYQITDWVIRCSGEECTNGTVLYDRRIRIFMYAAQYNRKTHRT